MIARYICDDFIGALVDRRILLCGLLVGAFVLTLALYLRRDGLRRPAAAPSTRAAAQPHEAMATPTGEAAPAAAMNPPPAVAPPEPVQSDPYSTPDVEDGARLARRDRGAERGSRSR
jgi:hypothetical protein